MRDRDTPLVAVADREGRARDRRVDAERAAGAADERRLAGAEVAGDADDVARARARREPGADRLGLLCRRRRRTIHQERSATRPSSEQAELDGRRLRLGASASCGDRPGGRRGAARPSSSGNRGSRPGARRACGACRERPRDGRSGRAGRAIPPSTTSCSRPCTRVIPSGLPESSLVAKFPSVQIDLRLDQLDLAEEVALARGDLLGLRVAVPGRPALQDVRHEHVVAGEADPGEELAEQLAGGADERDPLLVLVEARRLADEHDVRGRRARAEDRLGAGRPRAGSACSPRRRRRAPRAQGARSARQWPPQPQLPPQQPPAGEGPPKLGCLLVPWAAKTEN